MLDRKELVQKKKEIIKRLKEKNLSYEENEALRYSLIDIIYLLTQNDKLCNVKLYNMVDKCSSGFLSLCKMKKIDSIYNGINNGFKLNISDEYLSYLLQLVINIRKMENDNEDTTRPSFDISDDEIVKLVRDFYNNLGNEEISALANKIIDDPSHYGFTDTFNLLGYDSAGKTLYDYAYNKPYITVLRKSDIFRLLTFCHEVMHGIDFYNKQCLPTDKGFLFAETVPCTIEYLFLDYLDEMGFDHEQVRKLRKVRQRAILYHAGSVFYDICKRLLNVKELSDEDKDEIYSNSTIEDIKEVLDENLIKDLFIVESNILSYGLYKRILEDKEYGFNSLNIFMKNKIPNDKEPDFSFIGLSKERIIELSKEMETFIIENNGMMK